MRNVPVALQAHLDSGATTVTYLLRIEPVTPGFDPIGITLLDKDVVYDDGDGEVTYLAKIGMVPANLESTSGMDVDNTESQHLFPEFDLPISEADMTAGVLDFAKQRWMLVNYEDLSMGHVELTRGTTGRARSEDGQSFFLELVDQSKQLMQSIVEKDSITCRA